MLDNHQQLYLSIALLSCMEPLPWYDNRSLESSLKIRNHNGGLVWIDNERSVLTYVSALDELQGFISLTEDAGSFVTVQQLIPNASRTPASSLSVVMLRDTTS